MLQAAASAVAATVTLLATGAPVERHGRHAVTQRLASAITVEEPASAPPHFAGAVAHSAERHRSTRKAGRKIVSLGGAATSLSSHLAPEPVASTVPVAHAAQPAASPAEDPPSQSALSDASGSQRPVAPAALGGSGVVTADAAALTVTVAPADRSSTGAQAAGGGKDVVGNGSLATALPVVKPVVRPVVSPVEAGLSGTAAGSPSSAKPAIPIKRLLPARPVLAARPVLPARLVLPRGTRPRAPRESSRGGR